MNKTKRAEYHPKWELIIRMVCKRAEGRCEECGVQGYSYVRRGPRFGGYRYATDAELAELARLSELGTQKRWGRRKALKYLKLTYVHLEVGHLDRNRANNRFTNLKAMCQACHLQYDRPQHLRSRTYGKLHDREHQLTVFQPSHEV